MSDYIFLFDLDSTITRKEVLPEIAKKINCSSEMQALTESAMCGNVPFKNSFLQRVELLKDISVQEVNEIVTQIPLNDAIADFIKNNTERCYIVTGNLDIWISGLMKKLGMESRCYCSKADVVNDRITKVVNVIDKEKVTKQFVQPIVAIGDGDNDVGMIKNADIGIGFGGVREIAPVLLENADVVFYEDRRCADYLWKLL